MNTEYEIIEGLKAGYEEAYKYILRSAIQNTLYHRERICR